MRARSPSSKGISKCTTFPLMRPTVDRSWCGRTCECHWRDWMGVSHVPRITFACSGRAREVTVSPAGRGNLLRVTPASSYAGQESSPVTRASSDMRMSRTGRAGETPAPPDTFACSAAAHAVPDGPRVTPEPQRRPDPPYVPRRCSHRGRCPRARCSRARRRRRSRPPRRRRTHRATARPTAAGRGRRGRCAGRRGSCATGCSAVRRSAGRSPGRGTCAATATRISLSPR